MSIRRIMILEDRMVAAVFYGDPDNDGLECPENVDVGYVFSDAEWTEDYERHSREIAEADRVASELRTKKLNAEHAAWDRGAQIGGTLLPRINKPT